MNNFLKFIRLVTAIFSLIAGLSVLAVIIYFFTDYETHVILNSNVSEFTIGFMFFIVTNW